MKNMKSQLINLSKSLEPYSRVFLTNLIWGEIHKNEHGKYRKKIHDRFKHNNWQKLEIEKVIIFLKSQKKFIDESLTEFAPLKNFTLKYNGACFGTTKASSNTEAFENFKKYYLDCEAKGYTINDPLTWFHTDLSCIDEEILNPENIKPE